MALTLSLEKGMKSGFFALHHHLLNLSNYSNTTHHAEYLIFYDICHILMLDIKVVTLLLEKNKKYEFLPLILGHYV